VTASRTTCGKTLDRGDIGRVASRLAATVCAAGAERFGRLPRGRAVADRRRPHPAGRVGPNIHQGGRDAEA